MKPSILRSAPAAATCLALVGCLAPISVNEVTPEPPPARALPEATLEALREPEARDPFADLGSTLDALRGLTRRVAAGDDQAIPELNFLTGRLVDQLIAADVQPWMNSLRVRSGETDVILRGTQPPDLGVSPRRFVPADRLDFRGRYADEDAVREGVGAPLVAFLPSSGSAAAWKPGENVRYRSVTAFVHFEGDGAVIDLLDPLEIESVRIGPREIPLKANFGAHIAYALSEERIDKLGLVRLLNPARYDDTARLIRLQPYDPERIPVLFVHGLQDTPASFAPMYFELMEDPVIRERFQFWAFSYPSGYPYPMPAADLRRELDRINEEFPDHKDLVIVGHSMGGLISRLMVTDVGESIWLENFGTPPDQTDISGRSRELLERSLVFEARPEIGRAVFFSTPHRGSVLASNIIGWIAIKLVRFPNTLVDVLDTAVNVLSLDQSRAKLERFPSSIDTLSPQNRFVKTINRFPIEPTIPYHSVMGGRGKHDPIEESSDGVVAYWSSHLDGAASEKLVPSGHRSHQHPAAIEELRRILYLHAGLDYTPEPLEPVQRKPRKLRTLGPR